MFQESLNEVLFCNYVVAWISSQLPEQKEGLLVLLLLFLFIVIFVVVIILGTKQFWAQKILGTKNEA